jgi:hypothetical protein
MPHGQNVYIKPLEELDDRMRFALATSGKEPVRGALRVVAQMYRGFVQRRFDIQSRGGGEWPYLSKSTLAGRRRKKFGKLRTKKGKRRKFRKGAHSLISERPRILWDQGLLRGALAPHFPGRGALEKRVEKGVRVGYGGPHRHGSGAATIADIAEYHQTGAGHLPVREIIVDPDNRTQRQMGAPVRRALQELTRDVVR